MTDYHGKRRRDPYDGERGSSRGAKSSKLVEDFLESMDPSVRIKLRSMLDDGLLRTDDLDERNISDLSRFDASQALEILEHYCSGDLSQVRNRRGYLAGAIRRQLQMVMLRPSEEVPLSADGMLLLAPEVQHRFDQIKHYFPRAGELDERSLEALAGLPPHLGLAVLDRYGAKDFDRVRNPSALFMTLVRQVSDAPEEWAVLARAPRGDHQYPHDRPGPYSSTPAPAPPPPPPPRQLQHLQAVAPVAAGGLQLGAALTQGPGGSLVLAGAPVVEAVPGQGAAAAAAAGAAAGAAAPGLVLTATAGLGGVQQYVLVSTSAAQVVAGAASVLPAAAAGAAPPAGVPAEWAAARKDHGGDQGLLGVRVAEFHDLSPFAPYVHPSSALKLQQLWDNGNELVRVCTLGNGSPLY